MRLIIRRALELYRDNAKAMIAQPLPGTRTKDAAARKRLKQVHEHRAFWKRQLKAAEHELTNHTD